MNLLMCGETIPVDTLEEGESNGDLNYMSVEISHSIIAVYGNSTDCYSIMMSSKFH